jgi:mandelate racemase
MCVTETAHWLEWQDWAYPILTEPFQLQNGYLMIPEVPGSGIRWNEDAIKRYAA